VEWSAYVGRTFLVPLGNKRRWKSRPAISRGLRIRREDAPGRVFIAKKTIAHLAIKNHPGPTPKRKGEEPVCTSFAGRDRWRIELRLPRAAILASPEPESMAQGRKVIAYARAFIQGVGGGSRAYDSHQPGNLKKSARVGPELKAGTSEGIRCQDAQRRASPVGKGCLRLTFHVVPAINIVQTVSREGSVLPPTRSSRGSRGGYASTRHWKRWLRGAIQREKEGRRAWTVLKT